ncbi:hypothetical protein E1B28_012296 [Marasmius oreades]|uniref:Asl1-like glycosyl hydrolase catalytic domain-containing protein n=1 Tax=Marasmius oreades TaxID=181124 RepID=A0A9P7RRW5_9AGAR|nr:uncharacterized protein E1B28_012296 [Marasmius oreades]KAG7088283.1 hypothetical protein E1B28_012296 [Marasmius oreades]
MFRLLILALSSTLICAKNAKRGLSFASVDNTADVLNFNQTASEISWIYDWGTPVPPYLASSGVEYIPMQWGAGNIENLSTTVKAQGSKVILGFNEPDFKEQSNIDPNFAAQLWMKYIEPLKASGVRLGGPAVSSGGSGIPWMTSFLAACSNCTIDFIPVHWYGTGVAGFYDYLWQMHNKSGNKTLWITEYANTSLNQTEVDEFLNQTTTYLDGLDWVERYAWFGYFRPANGSAYNFMNADGGLNDLGKHYIGADTVVRSGPSTATQASNGGGNPTKSLPTVSAGAGRQPTFLPANNHALARWKFSISGLVGAFLVAIASI